MPISSPSAAQSLLELSQLAAQLAPVMDAPVQRAGEIIWDSLQKGGKLLACGNGGSAADAQHFVAELVGRMAHERRALAAITLNADPSVVTALANDYGYENLFARQVQALGRPGDVLLGLSTSGRSPNILRALQAARQMGLRTIALAGAGGDLALETCDVCIHVPSSNTQRVQELHTALLHAICEQIEIKLLADNGS